MPFQIHPRVLILGFASLFTVSLAVYGGVLYHRRGHKSDLLAFISLMLSISLFELGSLFASLVTSVEMQLLALNFTNTVAIWLLFYSLLWFALAYSNNTKWVNRWTVGIAAMHIVVSSTAAVVAPEYLYEVNGFVTHGPVTIFGITFNEWVFLDRELKLPFRVVQLYTYIIMLLAGGILGRYLLQNRSNLYTGQAAALAVGIATPLIVNSLLFIGVTTPGWNPTDFAFAVTGVAFAIAIFRYRLLRVAPVGREQLVDRMGDPVVMLDDEGRVVDCNPAARELVDAPSGWRGIDAREFFAAFPEQFDRFAGRCSVKTEVEVTTDGTRRHFNLDIAPIENAENDVTGQLIVLHDVTEQKERERQLERQNDRLGQFASVVSHDLRNPLTAAQLRFDLIREDIPEEHAVAVEENLNRMETMIDDLLTLARSGQTVENADEVKLTDIVREAWAHADITDCEFESTIPEGTRIEADRDRLLHVFENLYRNAADHNDSPVTVRVGLLGAHDPTTDGGQPTGFFVEDDGSGISDERVSDIFEHGYTTSTDGTGFGLSIVRDIIEAHGWEIRMTDGADGGARFEITGVDMDR